MIDYRTIPDKTLLPPEEQAEYKSSVETEEVKVGNKTVIRIKGAVDTPRHSLAGDVIYGKSNYKNMSK